MSNQDSPTPPAPAEVCERLREAADALHHEAELSFHIKAMQLHRHAHNITSALLLIEQGEQERERLDWLLHRYSYADGRTDAPRLHWGLSNHGRAAIDAARAQPTPEIK